MDYLPVVIYAGISVLLSIVYLDNIGFYQLPFKNTHLQSFPVRGLISFTSSFCFAIILDVFLVHSRITVLKTPDITGFQR